MFDETDMILPEGFNPDLGDQNFNQDGSLVEAQPTESAPTTEPAPVETPTPDTSAPAPEAAPQEPTTVTEPAPVVETPKVKVKYNHEERELSLDDAAIYAQKGMNFDKVDARAKELEAKISRYENQAKLFGFDNADAMMTNAQSNFVESKVKDMVDQGVAEPMARFLVNQEMEKQKTTSPSAPKLDDARRAEIEEFNAAYPDVTKIPDEVFQMHVSGVRLKTAYGIYEKNKAQADALAKIQAEHKAAQDELAILKQNQASAAKAPVVGTVGQSAPTKEEAEDPFLKGFNSDY